MKREPIICALMCLFLLAACGTPAPAPTPTPEPGAGMINPGDTIDGMLFTAVDEIDWDVSLSFLCDHESMQQSGTTYTLPCSAWPGDPVFFGNCNGILFDTPEEAAELWGAFEMEVTFDGRPVNLPPFGYLDTETYGMDEAYLRMWNLAVENIAPGTHTVQCRGQLKDEPSTRVDVYVLTVSAEPETFSPLPAAPPAGLHPYSSQEEALNYLLYVPGEYGVDPERRWPLLIYLHGLERASAASVLVLQGDHPLSALIDQDDFPFVVVAPKASGEYSIWATDEMDAAVMTLVDEIQSALAVDPNRVYLTGVSAGGNGAWAIGLRHPDRFAALAPVMGYATWPWAVPENICNLVNVPVRAFHGALDETVPLEAEQSVVDALVACGGDAQLTVFADAGHELDSQRVYTSDLYAWLLEQSLR